MWARLWFSMPAERPPRPPPFTPPPPPPAPPQYGPLPAPSSVASLYTLAGDFLDRAKTALVTGGPAGPDTISAASSARRAVAELMAPASKASPAATTNDSWTLSSRAVHWIIVGAVVAAVLLVLCVVACFVRRRRRRRRRRPVLTPQLPPPMVYHKDGVTWPVLQQATPSEFYFAQQQRPTPPQTSGTFSDAGTDRHHSVDVVTELPTGGSHTYEQLAAATDGFAPGNIIGQGGFGCVYRGTLDGAEVAIKKLKAGSRQGDREFRAEVEIISRVHHRNLVSLVGYCIYSDERLLVYEFVPNKTLDSHLHGHNGPPLDWHQRWQIAVGSARGLAYLHDDCYPKIIHRDVKASNILLDQNFEPKVADFGLAKYQPGDDTHVSTRVMGTFGYIAPEFLSSGRLTDKADVFSFGVVLLELITGRLPVQSSQSYMDETLVGWARPLISQVAEGGSLQALMDPRLGSDYDPSIMMRMVECAAAAVRHSAQQRPSMVQILKYLQGETRADDPDGVFKITTVEESYSSSMEMESGESVGPRPRRTQRSQASTSNDCISAQAPGDKDPFSSQPLNAKKP
ncbi:hypothetical protein PAHAL_9G517600 [Panicum hallii]|uniref:non-specific serine/threonine protein kinase n=1 Tax=Panicum hallii TaxID=206008 RepID=A0A2S3IS11_9POAL|nr:hypothetical protein PAHAL_9G517600 [Panicum hallii]